MNLTHRVEFQLDIQLLSPLHIGAGNHDDSTAHDTTIRLEREYDEQGQVVLRIPGSTLKGVMRAEVERLLMAVGMGDEVCNVGKEEHVDGKPCAVCSWFGHVPQHKKGISSSTGQRSRFFISDAQPTADFVLEEKWIQKKAMTPINRFHQIPLPLQVEVVPDQKHFFTRLVLENPVGWELTIIAFILRFWEQGKLRMGGGTARGLGITKATIVQLTIDDYGGTTANWLVKTIKDNQKQEWWGNTITVQDKTLIWKQLAFWGQQQFTLTGREAQ